MPAIYVASCYILHLRPLPSNTEGDDIRRLRAALKVLLRSYGLECVHAHDAIGRPLDADDHGSGSPSELARALARQFREIAAMLDGADLPPDGADDYAVALASMATQADALHSRLLASSCSPDGSRRRTGRPRRRKPPAGL